MKKCIKCDTIFDGLFFLCPNCGFYPQIINGYASFSAEFINEKTNFPPEVFKELYHLESRNFWFNARNNLLLWMLDIYFPNAEKMLEIGCGTGYVLNGIAQARPELDLYGSEILLEGLQHASQRFKRKNKLFQIDASQIPFREEFDIIGAFDVLEHIKEDEIVLKQMYQAVTRGGGVIITVPQHTWMWSETDEIAQHQRRYTARELKTKMENAGFSCVYITSFVSLLLPAMFISRLRKRNKSYQTHYDKELNELRLSDALNGLFKHIMAIEMAILKLNKKGMKLPFGGSLLAVGKTLK